ncbi:nuclear transport factor 2 family protein [Agromyces sp. H3Y2-19a]|jgi:ketosteroid isomerase-like protein|uniref:YybH family protein n=1 Tax=Agromyces TaxID=33877 RepID=UPI001E5D5620|nr:MULTISPECIES: nuclear transport factor 2 family protein [Agromyces]MCD5348100.1 nuclear transport factor 2 family protein [Agromyces sp. S2-1-8]MDF0514301.1 nuclear transport factor 2 family protein [Agromyces chromiiresistens]
MSDREDFLIWLHEDFVRAERAMFNGDDGPRRAIWAEDEPVSVLGAWRNATNRAELIEAFEELATSFSDCTDYAFDLVSFDVGGEMAYTVGYERVAGSVDGQPRTFTLRATQVYRRGDDGWRVVHRHADKVG